MKLSEKAFESDGKLIVQETHDFTPILEQAKTMRFNGMTGNSHMRPVGLIPMKLWEEWAKRWGVSAGDHDAMRDVVAKEMSNPDNAGFRVWEGKF